MVAMRIALVLLARCAQGFYLPGVAPREYMPDERVDIKVNKLSSTKTQLPYDYYSLPFCRPDSVTNAVENIGEVLHGSVIQNSAYDIRMNQESFKVLCRMDIQPATVKLLAQRIQEDYRVHLIMDNLPAATKMIREMPDGKSITMYDRGYPLGFVGSKDRPNSQEGVSYVYNHLRFVIKFHKEPSFTGARIVGFEVEPLSVKHNYKGAFTTDMQKLSLLTVPVGPDLPPQPALSKGANSNLEIIYTYDVKWEYSDIKWASRWDLYLYMGDDQIHWCADAPRPPVSPSRAPRTRPAARPSPPPPRHPSASRRQVLDHQLARDRPAAHGHRRDDHDAHAPPRLQPVQRGRQGGPAGGVGVEARARRRVPPAAGAGGALRVARHRDAALRDVGRLDLLRDARLPLARQPRLAPHRDHPRVHAHGRARRLLLRAHVQVDARHRVEVLDGAHRDALPVPLLRRLLRPQLLHLGAGARARRAPSAAALPARPPPAPTEARVRRRRGGVRRARRARSRSAR